MFVLCVDWGGGGLMAETTPEELVFWGIKSYKKQNFLKYKGNVEKAGGLKNGGGSRTIVFL
ncbi:hypothetical protein ID0623_03100 [Helicobacter pylori]